MDSFENIINELQETDEDNMDFILNKMKYLEKTDKKEISPEILHRLIIRLDLNPKREELWNCLLSYLIPEKIPNEMIEYFIKNKVAIMQLCHMELQDKWLKKLAVYDDAPIYTLAKRIFLSDNYSDLDFVDFYQQYLDNKSDVSSYLLDSFEDATKRNLLIYLCFQNDEFENKEKLEWYSIAEQLKNMTDEGQITEMYEKYQDVAVILCSIAGNLFTSKDILLKLSKVKGINGANEIRKSSNKSLRLKNKCGLR